MYLIYNPFLISIAVAGLLSIATASAKVSLDKKFNSPMISAGIITSLLAFLLFGPIFYFLITITSAVNSFDPTSIEKTMILIKDLLGTIPHEFQLYTNEINDFLNKIDYASISQSFLSILGQTGAKSASFITDIILILIFFFMFHIYGEKITVFAVRAVPYQGNKIKNSFKEISSTMSTVSYSIISTAIFEGALFGVFISFFGYDGLFFGILYGFASLIPVVGGLLMWLPLALYELSQGDVQSALFIMLYTVIVISIFADTFIRPLIIEVINKKVNKTESEIHSLVIFFSIVAGLTTFGFWGAILGPGVTALFFGATTLMEEEHSTKSKT